MRRRRLLGLLGVGIGLGSAGCSSGDRPATGPGASPTPSERSSPPEYDCGEASRPTITEDVRARGDTIEQLSYPDGPPPLDERPVVEYVTQYERAYVQKRLRNDVRGRVVEFGLGTPESETFDVPGAAALVRLRYTYFYEVERADGPVHADSPTNYTTYYVDKSVVVRARREGVLDDESALVPDPWETGEPVECFD